MLMNTVLAELCINVCQSCALDTFGYKHSLSLVTKSSKLQYIDALLERRNTSHDRVKRTHIDR